MSVAPHLYFSVRRAGIIPVRAAFFSSGVEIQGDRFGTHRMVGAPPEAA